MPDRSAEGDAKASSHLAPQTEIRSRERAPSRGVDGVSTGAPPCRGKLIKGSRRRNGPGRHLSGFSGERTHEEEPEPPETVCPVFTGRGLPPFHG